MQEVQDVIKDSPERKFPRWLLFVLIGVFVMCLIVGGAGFYVFRTNEYLVDLSINGDEVITLEFGQPYEEPGATAVGFGTLLKKDPQQLEVLIKGNVDVSILGTYELSYRATFEGTESEVIRTVHVVDTVAPEITLVTDPEHFTFPGQPYEEEGFTAFDNYDGDLTSKVTVQEQDGKIIYTVTDTAGNETSIERLIRYDDPIAPELTLKGDAKITITEGNKWKEPGYTATDNVDGDLTAQVSVSGTVNDTKPGTYKLTYEVKDQYGNSIKTERIVTVKAKPKPVTPPQTGTSSGSQGETSGSGQGKVIYLTFDDGPSKHTSRLLQILAKYNVKATFFVCNTGNLGVLDDIVKAGHTLGLHSKTHKYKQIYASESAYFEDLYAIQNIVEKYSGVKSTLMRFPGGSSTTQGAPGIMTTLTKSVQEKGFTYFDWNIDSRDAVGAKTADEVAQNVINGISKSKRKNLVVLQHDIKGYSVDAVEQILQWGFANGCTFKALTANGPTCHHNVNN
jgi:peptidoglycan/xylan/chitin deacetylase (PgdA/CDA1 family)